MKQAGIAAAQVPQVVKAINEIAVEQKDIVVDLKAPVEGETVQETIKGNVITVVDAFLPSVVSALKLELKTNPTKFLDHFNALLEYATPKLGRTELEAKVTSENFVHVTDREERPVIDITPRNPS